MQIRQSIFKCFTMQICRLFFTAFWNFWRITRLSTTNHRWVINAQTGPVFWPTPTLYISWQYTVSVRKCHPFQLHPCHANCKTPDVHTVRTISKIAINYAQLKCSRLSENIFIIFTKPQCFSTCRLWTEQRSSLVNPNIVTKLQFIHLKNLVTLAEKDRHHLMKMTR